jgi:dihydrofolate reductase
MGATAELGRKPSLLSLSRRTGPAMGKVKFTQTMSLDGYTAGPEQTREKPLGKGGEELHEWMFATRTFRQMGGREGGDTGLDDECMRRWNENVGAHIMGRNMFDPVRGATRTGGAGG